MFGEKYKHLNNYVWSSLLSRSSARDSLLLDIPRKRPPSLFGPFWGLGPTPAAPQGLGPGVPPTGRHGAGARGCPLVLRGTGPEGGSPSSDLGGSGVRGGAGSRGEICFSPRPFKI